MVFDAVVVALILAAACFGAWRGFASQVAGILSLIAGFLVAIPLSAPLAPLFGSKGPLNRLIALAVVYAIVSLGMYVLAFRYYKMIQKWKLESWDRHLGTLMGAFKGCILAITLTFFAITLFSGLREPILRTSTGRLMGRVVRALHPIWPTEVHDILHPYHHLLDAPPGTDSKPAPGERRRPLEDR